MTYRSPINQQLMSPYLTPECDSLMTHYRREPTTFDFLSLRYFDRLTLPENQKPPGATLDVEKVVQWKVPDQSPGAHIELREDTPKR